MPMSPLHETWFVHDPAAYPLDWTAMTRPTVVAGVTAAGLLALAWRGVGRRLPVPELPPLARLGRLAAWAPRLLALHLGVSLVLLAWRRAVLDPGIGVPTGWLGTALLLPEVFAGVLLVAGRQTQWSAGAVASAGPVVLAMSGPTALLSCLVLLGIAVFLLLLPPRPGLAGRAVLDHERLRLATLALRVGAAGTLITLAVVEKLANPAMAHAMLVQKPVLDLLSPFGISSDRFALIAGCTEVLFGLLVLSGALPQVVALVAAIPFSATLLVFGGTELIGHLPVYGILLCLLLLGSRRDTSLEVSRVRRTLVAV